MRPTAHAGVGPPGAGVQAEELDGRVALYSPVTEQIVYLNETASFIWSLCTGEHSLDEIVGTVALRYAQEAVRVDADVRRVLEELTSAGLFDPSTATART